MIELRWPGELANDIALRSDVAVTWLGAFGAVLFLRTARRAGATSGLQPRAQLLMGVFAAMLIIRGFAWMWPDRDWLGVVFHVPATLQPLALAVYVEGLLRRHLPLGVKRLAAGATAIAFVGNIVTGIADNAEWRVTFSIVFMAALLVTLMALGIVLLRRDRSTLSGSENALIRDNIVLALIGLPLAATDFRDSLHLLPVRMGTIVVLMLAFILLSPPQSNTSRGPLLAAVRLVTWGIAGAAVIALVLGVESTVGVIATVVVCVALVLLVGITYRARDIARGADIDWLLRWLGRPTPATSAEWERELRQLPLMADAIIVGERDLGAYHLDAVRQIVEQAGPVISRAALRAAQPDRSGQAALAADELADLLERNEASHIGVLGLRPLRLALVTLPEVAGARGSELALAAIMRHGPAASGAGIPDDASVGNIGAGGSSTKPVTARNG